MPCYSPLKGFKDPDNGGWIPKRTSRTTEKMEVACGQCLGCRLDNSLMWAIRIVHESTLHRDNCFVTLTYRDERDATEEQYRNAHYLPRDGSLNKKHFKDFIKRVRKRFPEKRIRYFHCGEYGDESYRPHYHACLFGITFDDLQLFRSDEGIHTFSSPTLDSLWPYGFSTIGELNYETAAYTARYVLKKITGAAADTHYLRCDEYGVAYWLQPEYVTMSLKPGLGHDFYQAYENDFTIGDSSPVPGKGMVQKVPRYYEKILAEQDPETLERLKATRKQFIRDHADDFTPERIMDKYRVQKQKLNEKRRSKI